MTDICPDFPIGSATPALKLSDVLRDLDQSQGERISLGDLIFALGERSFVPLMILFALPNVFFFVPGSSVITGLPLIFIASQLVLGRPAAWLPKVLYERSIEHGGFTRIVRSALPWIEWVERMAKPRYWPFSKAAAERIVGMISLVMAIFMFLPIPFANSLPAVSVITLALGMGEQDGLWLAGGGVGQSPLDRDRDCHICFWQFRDVQSLLRKNDNKLMQTSKPTTVHQADEAPASGPARTAALSIGAVGIVYGDIGTSPLYAFREAIRPAAEDGLAEAEVYGVVSLLLWALLLIVTLKYVLFLLRADNRGEGGILSLFALVQDHPKRSGLVFVLGVSGAALFFGDAIITPAISVLSAVEGMKLVTPVLEPYVLPISIGILVSLFMVQSRGTGPLARWFGPITALWFIAMGAAGAAQIAETPGILGAFDPRFALSFMMEHATVGFVVLGAVFLSVTGAEALYADLGHFGRKPIQLAWFLLVLPALSLNYLGQGALVLQTPAAVSDPFFLMVPPWALPGLVVLATIATVIASQAVITGAFSMTRQAIQLGLLPRLVVRHTSTTETGQIFLPVINTLLLVGVVILVVAFQTSSALAAAYGIAVSGTMIITTALAYLMLNRVWHLHRMIALAALFPIFLIELAFLTANLAKVPDGGYVPLLLGILLVVVMWTWARGTQQLFDRSRKVSVPLADFIPRIEGSSAHRVPGTAVFLTSDRSATPPALLHNLKHNHVLHEHIIVLTVETRDIPRVPESDRAVIERLTERFERVSLRFGYMETPNINRSLALCRKQGLQFEGMKTSFFLGRRKLVARAEIGMPIWQDHLYIFMSRMAADPSDFYHLPRDRVVELGSQVAV